MCVLTRLLQPFWFSSFSRRSNIWRQGLPLCNHVFDYGWGVLLLRVYFTHVFFVWFKVLSVATNSPKSVGLRVWLIHFSGTDNNCHSEDIAAYRQVFCRW